MSEATHVLLIFDAGQTIDDDRAVHKIYGPLTEVAARDLGNVFNAVNPMGVYFEVQPMEAPPFVLTTAGREVAESKRRTP